MTATTAEAQVSADRLVRRLHLGCKPARLIAGVSWIMADRRLGTRAAPATRGQEKSVVPAEAEEPFGMRWRRTFPGHADQARSAREFVAFLLAGCAFADDAVLAVAELVANALRHTRSASPCGRFAVEVRQWRSGTSISVSDQGGTSEPKAREADDMEESGRGLKTVAALASRWDWTGDANGRTVIAVFDER